MENDLEKIAAARARILRDWYESKSKIKLRSDTSFERTMLIALLGAAEVVGLVALVMPASAPAGGTSSRPVQPIDTGTFPTKTLSVGQSISDVRIAYASAVFDDREREVEQLNGNFDRFGVLKIRKDDRNSPGPIRVILKRIGHKLEALGVRVNPTAGPVQEL